jgi:hypothetical protein
VSIGDENASKKIWEGFGGYSQKAIADAKTLGLSHLPYDRHIGLVFQDSQLRVKTIACGAYRVILLRQASNAKEHFVPSIDEAIEKRI